VAGAGRGAIDVSSIRTVDAPAVDLMPGHRFIAAAGRDDDRTLLAVALPAAVAAGGSVQLEIGFRAAIPRAISGAGYAGPFNVLAGWYPQLDGPNGGFANYDVRITAPDAWTIGATGARQSHTANRDGTITDRFTQAAVPAFVWAADRSLVSRRDRIDDADVEIELLLQPEHASQADRELAAARTAVQRFREWFGPYPYRRLTIVDAPWQSRAAGQSGPMLITSRTRWIQPASDLATEAAIAEGVAMQYWAASIAPASADRIWLERGLSRYSASRLMPELFARVSRVPGAGFHVERFFGGFVPYVWRAVPHGIDGDLQSRAEYRAAPARMSPAKATVALETLERYLGWPALQRVMQAYAERFRDGHPTAADFFAMAGEITGRDLSWYTDPVYRTGATFDYGVDRLDSRRDGDARGPARYRTTVVVRRHGSATFSGTSRPPVGPFEAGDAIETAITFAGGPTVTARWDGRAPLKAFEFESASPAVTAEVDPQHVLVLDTNWTNNSRTLTPSTDRAARKWALTWMTWLEDFLLSAAALV
jgi:hypothetical protein